MLAAAAKAALEGSVCKQATASYRASRAASWVKVDNLGRAEFVILGWTPPSGSRTGLGALYFARGVGTGFSDATLITLHRHLDHLAGTRPPALIVGGEPVSRAVR